ncbi:10708_t:CDS:2 [Gigaspora margarita]|uniref:10708_t:CDS:1 n=1 Tax=Gigaspora margarita TaxID=4874 RepID=A0ABN7UGG2_GIGMA|nr:10708_t:CDS:2 [Gigaspora margarita]
MASKKIKITNNEIPNVNPLDNIYETCCQYFTNERLGPIYDPHKYFCNQSNNFHATLRNINKELKKNNENYIDGYIFSAAYKYVKENRRLVSCEIGFRRDSISNEEPLNNTIEHFSNDQPLLAWNAETMNLKIKIAIYKTKNTNIRIENANFISQINTLEKDSTDLKFKIGGLEKDNTELKSKNTAKFKKDEEAIKDLEKEITETNEEKDKIKKSLLAIIDDRNTEIKSKNKKIDKLKAENLKLIMEQKKEKKCNK